MDLDQLLVGFFGRDYIDNLAPEQLAAGLDQLRLQFGLERNRGRGFALWFLAYMLGAAPDLDVAFKDKRIEKQLATSWTPSIARSTRVPEQWTSASATVFAG